jgi:hypothetical protein
MSNELPPLPPLVTTNQDAALRFIWHRIRDLGQEAAVVGIMRSLDATMASSLLSRAAHSLRDFLLTGTSNQERAKLRPMNYDDLSPEEQWKIDNDLGLLDWDGT